MCMYVHTDIGFLIYILLHTELNRNQPNMKLNILITRFHVIGHQVFFSDMFHHQHFIHQSNPCNFDRSSDFWSSFTINISFINQILENTRFWCEYTHKKVNSEMKNANWTRNFLEKKWTFVRRKVVFRNFLSIMFIFQCVSENKLEKKTKNSHKMDSNEYFELILSSEIEYFSWVHLFSSSWEALHHGHWTSCNKLNFATKLFCVFNLTVHFPSNRLEFSFEND